MKINKTFWLHFDLDFRGDYENLYRWLDEQGAEDCGDNMALLKIMMDSDDKNYSNFFKNSLEQAGFKPSPKDRIYLIWKEDNKMKGIFLFGERKKTPQWAGYSKKNVEVDSE